MASFMLIARDVPQDFADVSPEDMQRIIEKYVAWGNKLEEAGKKRAGNKLRDGEGRVLRGNGGKLAVTDGPFSETKEVIGGYWLIEAAAEATGSPRDSRLGCRYGSRRTGGKDRSHPCSRIQTRGAVARRPLRWWGSLRRFA